MSAVLLVLFSLTLRPITSLDALMLRWEIASGIVEATDDPTYQRVLMVVASEESQFRRDVADCRVYGDGGRAATAWQFWFRSDGERWYACHNQSFAAGVALQRIRESESMCRHLPHEEQLNAYCTGTCTSQLGKAISRRRWRIAAEGLP